MMCMFSAIDAKDVRNDMCLYFRNVEEFWWNPEEVSSAVILIILGCGD